MKLKLVFVAALLLSLKSFAYDGTPEEIRSIKQAMYRSIESARVTDSLYVKLKSKPPANALMILQIWRSALCVSKRCPKEELALFKKYV